MSDATPSITPEKNVPKHIAIIMDGNGRWAKERGKPRIEGHYQGAKQIEKVLEASKELGVKYITLFAFSSENWNRPKEEVDALMELLLVSTKEKKESFIKNKIRFMTIGDISALPERCVEVLEDLKNATKDFEESTLILALNYGSRDELVRAVSKISKSVANGEIDPDKITYQTISDNLDTANIPDPDLLIRTSGEERLSNYLLLQCAYAEFYFTKTYWPDFGKEELIKAVEEYQRRERRYGLTGEQLNPI